MGQYYISPPLHRERDQHVLEMNEERMRMDEEIMGRSIKTMTLLFLSLQNQAKQVINVDILLFQVLKSKTPKVKMTLSLL
jgi:hypothetical protein